MNCLLPIYQRREFFLGKHLVGDLQELIGGEGVKNAPCKSENAPCISKFARRK